MRNNSMVKKVSMKMNVRPCDLGEMNQNKGDTPP